MNPGLDWPRLCLLGRVGLVRFTRLLCAVSRPPLELCVDAPAWLNVARLLNSMSRLLVYSLASVSALKRDSVRQRRSGT
jgi:hypothetical protein